MKNIYTGIYDDIILFKQELNYLYFDYHRQNNEYCYESVQEITDGLNELTTLKGYTKLKENNCFHLIELIISNLIAEVNELVKV